MKNWKKLIEIVSNPYVTLLRPKHWVKNMLVFFPLLFSGELSHVSSLIGSLWAFFSFCAIASSVYIWNDLSDIENDRLHPEKLHKRPLASGALSTKQSYAILACTLATCALAVILNPILVGPITTYSFINVAYSMSLKNIPILDAMCIAAGFVVRVWAGCVAIAVEPSIAIIATTFCASLFLAFQKRRAELSMHGTTARKALLRYSYKGLNFLILSAGVLSLLSYGVWAFSQPRVTFLSTFIVAMALFEYERLSRSKLDVSDSPTDLFLGSWSLIFSASLWLFIIILNRL